MMDEDYEQDYVPECPKCKHSPIHIRRCSNIHCEGGYEDMYDDDPINHPTEGEDLYECDDCKGTGYEIWCPKCGADLSGYDLSEPDSSDEQ